MKIWISKTWFRLWPSVFTALAFGFVVELVVNLEVVSPQIIPPPSELWKVLQGEFIIFKDAFISSFWHSFLGLSGAAVLALVLGFFFSLSSWLHRAFYPVALFFQTVPIVALAPLLVIYLGFGQPTVVASSLVVSFFPMLASTLYGFKSTPQEWLDLMKLARAHPWQVLWFVRWPWARGYFFSGLQVSAGLAVVGTIAGEFVAGGGLGALIDSARTQQRVDIVYLALILMASQALLFQGFFITVRWIHEKLSS